MAAQTGLRRTDCHYCGQVVLKNDYAKTVEMDGIGSLIEAYRGILRDRALLRQIYNLRPVAKHIESVYGNRGITRNFVGLYEGNLDDEIQEVRLQYLETHHIEPNLWLRIESKKLDKNRNKWCV